MSTSTLTIRMVDHSFTTTMPENIVGDETFNAARDLSGMYACDDDFLGCELFVDGTLWLTAYELVYLLQPNELFDGGGRTLEENIEY